MLKQQRGAAAVMDMSLFVLLLLSGLVCSASGFQRDYYYVNTRMSWTAAQSYCRERFTDLATVDSMDDVNRMMNEVNDGYSGSVWIGMKKPTQHGWVWSMGNEALTQYSPWWASPPPGNGDCVCSVGLIWYDLSCVNAYNFVCYAGMTSGSPKYIFGTEMKNWKDAQSYCRLNYIDLATIHNSAEHNQIVSIAGAAVYVWIGLSADSWQWSDQWSLSFSNWATGQPYAAGGDCVAMSTTDSGKWVQGSCDLQCPFICYEEAKFAKKLIVKLYFTHDGKYSLTDSSQQTAILNKISEKLQVMGLEGYKNISWRKDEGGEVFHLNNYIVNLNNTCDN